MVISRRIGIGLGLALGCLFLAFVAGLIYLLWWKKKIVRINNNNSSCSSNNSGNIGTSNDKRSSVERDVYNNYTKQLHYLFCLKQKRSSQSATTTTTTSDAEQEEEDIEIQNPKSYSFVDGEESIESELMRLHNLSGPPRFLFTIDEETKEDLIEFDRKSTSEANVVTSKRTSRTKSLNDFLNESPFFTPLSSPLANPVSDSYNNPLFETATESELYKTRSSPPPKFQFLRDAEEKMLRKLFSESEKTSVKNQDSDFVTLVVRHHNQSQILPLYSSPKSSVL